jgi:CBS domain-containing protein
MTVARILRQKGGDVITAQPNRTLQDVVALLAEKGIGAILVADASRAVLGILSERDIVRAIARGGPEALGEAVSKHMTPRVVSVREDTPLNEVMEIMTNGRFRHAPVMANGQLVGLISIGDVVKHHINEIESEHKALREYIATA